MSWFRRCPARLSHVDSPDFHGRCDLDRWHRGRHYLDRGLFSVFWSVRRDVGSAHR